MPYNCSFILNFLSNTSNSYLDVRFYWIAISRVVGTDRKDFLSFIFGKSSHFEYLTILFLTFLWGCMGSSLSKVWELLIRLRISCFVAEKVSISILEINYYLEGNFTNRKFWIVSRFTNIEFEIELKKKWSIRWVLVKCQIKIKNEEFKAIGFVNQRASLG